MKEIIENEKIEINFFVYFISDKKNLIYRYNM